MSEHDWTTTPKPPATQFQEDLMKQSIIRCTSTTRGTTWAGKHIYETDTGRHLFYDGSGWNLFVRRVMDSAKITNTGPAAMASATAINGSTLTFTAAANTTYKVVMLVAVRVASINDQNLQFTILRDGTNIWQIDNPRAAGQMTDNSVFMQVLVECLDIPGAGSVTYTFTCQNTAGSPDPVLIPTTAGTGSFTYAEEWSGS